MQKILQKSGKINSTQNFLCPSGRDEDKFEKANIKWEDATYVDAPILTDCPVSIECSVVDSTMPGTHELFIGKVEAIHVDEEYLDANGNILWDKIDLM